MREPEFKEEQGGIGVWFYKNADVYGNEILEKLGLNERQIRAVIYIKEHGKITNGEYMRLTKVSRQTATRDLSKLTKSKVVEKKGIVGKEAEYYLMTHNDP